MDNMVLKAIKNNNDNDLLYNLCCDGIYIPSIKVILYILLQEKTNYVNMIVEPDMHGNVECNIMRSIELFLQKTKNISEIQYNIMNLYFESIDSLKFAERISMLILATQDTKLKKFLNIWIGIDEEADKMLDKLIDSIRYPKKENDNYCCSIQ